MSLRIDLRRILEAVHALRPRRLAHPPAFNVNQMKDSQSVELYANTCRRVLREAGSTYSKWFFDADGSTPEFAFLHFFDMSIAKGLVHEYIVYFEAHFEPNNPTGKFATCTLEVGPSLGRSTPFQCESPITRSSTLIPFETLSEKHHLRGSAAVEWETTDSHPIFLTAEYSLTLIHPGTKEATKTITLNLPLNARQQTIPCPKCLGKGIFVEMAIPEAAYKSGLTGYQLFSENTVCGHVGCTLCGGSGTSYEDWYLKEKLIDKASTTPAVQGFGRITIC